MKKIIISRQNEKKKRGKWYYIMLAATVLTVGAVALITRNTADKVLNKNVEMSKTAVEKSVITSENEPIKKVITEEKKVVIPTVSKASEIPKKLEFIKPLEGNVIKAHSNTELVYSKTLGDWRIHKGIDIACPIGTEVRACEDGSVDAVYLDDRLGYTIIIKHENDVRTKYCNLDSKVNVKVGQAVSKGDKIGIVGDTSEFEIADEAHLHFEVMQGDDNVAPNLYITDY